MEASGLERETAEEFVANLEALSLDLDGFGVEIASASIDRVAGTSVKWERETRIIHPLLVETLRVVDDSTMPEAADSPLRMTRPGEWTVAVSAVREPFHPGLWHSRLAALVNDQSCGGITCNALTIPAGLIRSGELDVRPVVLHALAGDGRACDRGDTDAQAAVANAFWQTFWATGALRAERGSVFPVAFYPIDRDNPLEFLEPFRERYVTLRRRLFGRTAIMAFLVESITGAGALLFDVKACAFRLAPGYSHPVLPESDVALALYELNRTAFVDAYMGENALRFSAWREEEGQKPVGEPWGNPPATVEAFLAADASDPALVPIRRVVPFAGCAFLRDIVNHTDRLIERGKIQRFDGEILGATNSTFFLNFPEEYSTLHSGMNEPVSLLVEDGRTLQLKTMRRAAFVIDANGGTHVTTEAGNKLHCEQLIFEGEAASATYFTKAAKSFRENLFGPIFFGSVVIGNSIVETFEETTTEVPANAWVTGDSEAFGGPIDPEKAVEAELMAPGSVERLAIRHAMAVGPLLVRDGKIVRLGESREEFAPVVLERSPGFEESKDLTRTQLASALLDCPARGVPPTRFPYDWDQTRAPRTAIGVKENGDVLLAVVDGRANPPHSVGVTLAELAELMLALGCVEAMNMDGGGSSIMYVNDPAAAECKLRPEFADHVVSYPSDLGGNERLLPVPLVVCHRRSRSTE